MSQLGRKATRPDTFVGMTGEVEAPRCPECGALDVTVEAVRASACLPFPPVESLLCRCCGNTGTRLRLRERSLIQWSRGG